MKLIEFGAINHSLSSIKGEDLKIFEQLGASRITRWMKGIGHLNIKGVISQKQFIKQQHNTVYRAMALLEAATTHQTLPTGNEKIMVCRLGALLMFYLD